MLDNLVGIHIYRITQHRTRKPATIPLAGAGIGGQLAELVPRFIAAHSAVIDEESEIARAWYFEPKQPNNFSTEGIIQYGSSGYESEIVDRKTRKLEFKREVNHMDIIPLYFRIWVPPTGKYALIALQTFGLRSCVSRVLTQLSDAYRKAYDGYRVTVSAVLPIEFGSFRDGEVKSLTLLKRDFSSDRAESQLGLPTELVDYNVSFTAKRKANLGKLSELVKRLSLGTSRRESIDFDDTTFEEAQAFVRVGGKNRKVTVVGISKDSGKIDLSESITRLPNGHPSFNSISAEVEKIFRDIVAGEVE